MLIRVSCGICHSCWKEAPAATGLHYTTSSSSSCVLQHNVSWPLIAQISFLFSQKLTNTLPVWRGSVVVSCSSSVAPCCVHCWLLLCSITFWMSLFSGTLGKVVIIEGHVVDCVLSFNARNNQHFGNKMFEVFLYTLNSLRLGLWFR